MKDCKMFKDKDELKKIIENLDIDTSPDEKHKEKLRIQMLSEFNETIRKPQTVWRTIIKSRISKLAAAAVVIFAVCFFIITDRNEPEHKSTVTLEPQQPKNLTSVISLNMAFRDGGMDAVEEQLRQAEKKTKPLLKERITIDQLMCELGEC